MQWTKSIALALAVGFGVPTFVATVQAEDKTAETKPEPKKEVKGPRLWGHFAKMKTLNAEQKVKIEEIHKKALTEKKKIDEQEESEITALLTDEQKLELQGLKEEESAKKKAAAAEKGDKLEKGDKAEKADKEKPKKEEKKDDGM